MPFAHPPVFPWKRVQRILFCGLVVTAAWVRAAYPPQEPAASLDLLWRDVWARGADHAYALYMQKSKVPMAAATRESFAKELLELATTPHLSGIALQGAKSRFYRKDQLPPPEEINRAGFIHFLRPASKGDPIAERIYINVHPDHAVEVMRFIVTELLKPESSRRPGDAASAAAPVKRRITAAKLAGPSGLMERADAILIYACSLEDVDWALGCLGEYQAAHPDHFLTDLPAATRPRLAGVSTAADPPAALKSGSFGSYMASIAEKALRTEPAPADYAAFRTRARELLTKDGVDPDHPDRLSRRP